LVGKWLQILKDIAPSVTRVGLMVSTANVASAYYYRSFDALAPSLAMTPVATPIREVTEVEHVFELLAREPNSGLVIPGDVVLEAPPVRELIIRLAASRRLPVVFGRRPFVVDGGRSASFRQNECQIDPPLLSSVVVPRFATMRLGTM
jgi:putative ABC transport system substrate-binding protein